MYRLPRPKWRQARPRPAGSTRHSPLTAEDRRLIEEWRLARVRDQMNDALEYIQAESIHCGANPHMVQLASERIKRNLLSEWAKDILFGHCECPPDGTEQFLETEFGVANARPSRKGPALVGVVVDLPAKQ